MSDLASRLAQLEMSLSSSVVAQSQGIWLGGLFQPDAYITATRQAVAHQKGWSLEELVLCLDVGEESKSSEAFTIKGELT